MIQNIGLLEKWIENRLGDADAVRWAADALRKISPPLGADIVELLRKLAETASSSHLKDELKRTWRMLHVAALDRPGRDQLGIRRQLAGSWKEFSIEDLRGLVGLLRPRLTAKPRINYGEEVEPWSPEESIYWDFEASVGHLSEMRPWVKPSLIAQLGSRELSVLADLLTIEIESAIQALRNLGWEQGDIDDFLSMHRIDDPDVTSGDTDDDESDEKDPDAYKDDIAPTVRVLTTAIRFLAMKDSQEAKARTLKFRGRPERIMRRLFAFSLSLKEVYSGRDIGAYLVKLSDEEFWRTGLFPEIAALRALRFSDVPKADRASLEKRLLLGMPALVLGREAATDELSGYRDIEIARIVDNAKDAPPRLTEIILKRRAEDPEFPDLVPLFSPYKTFHIRSVTADGSVFVGLEGDELLAALVADVEADIWGDKDDAAAYVRSHRSSVINAIADTSLAGGALVKAWDLLLRWAHEKAGDDESDRSVVDQTVKEALLLSDDVFASLDGRLSYWLGTVSERIGDLAASDALWVRLLPSAVLAELKHEQESDDPEADRLSSAALNSPLGHLLTYLFGRYPNIPASGDPPELPDELAAMLKDLQGRPRAIVANRLVTQANYFYAADKDWLFDFVIKPMKENALEGRPLWEAFSRYAAFPRPQIWEYLQESIFLMMVPGRLSQEAQQRLIEIATIAWSTFWRSNSYKVDSARFRSALSVSTEGVRSATSRRFEILIRRRGEQQSRDEDAADGWPIYGKKFFNEIWPLEPLLQSGSSSDDFARVPASAGKDYFGEAVDVVLPYLRPVNVWSVSGGFRIDEENEELIRLYPEKVLDLLSAVISDANGGVLELDRLLELLIEADSSLRQDRRLRSLTRHVLR